MELGDSDQVVDKRQEEPGELLIGYGRRVVRSKEAMGFCSAVVMSGSGRDALTANLRARSTQDW
jgi:hypothetical protein